MTSSQELQARIDQLEDDQQEAIAENGQPDARIRAELTELRRRLALAAKRRPCTCQAVDRAADPCGHSDTSEGCPRHDPTWEEDYPGEVDDIAAIYESEAVEAPPACQCGHMRGTHDLPDEAAGLPNYGACHHCDDCDGYEPEEASCATTSTSKLSEPRG